MIKNYLISALRRFWRQRAYTIINILGLSSGLAVAIVMLLTTRYQLSFDKFHEHKDIAYQVQIRMSWQDQEYTNQTCQAPVAFELKNNYPEIEQACRLRPTGELLFTTFDNGGDIDKKIVETKGMAADSTIWDIFTFPLLTGNQETALSDPYSVVLSKNLSRKYFGDKNPIGQHIRINDEFDFTVTGIMEEVPKNSHFQFDFIIPVHFLTNLGISLDGYVGSPYHTFIKLHEGSTTANIDSTITDFYYSIHEPDMECKLQLSPLSLIHYSSEEMGDVFIPTFGIIGLFILILACINYMNISTATSLGRSKEIAIRKVNGATRGQLRRQLLGESMIITLISLNVAFILVELITDFYNNLSQENISFEFTDPSLLWQVLILTIFTGFVAGTYPAFFTSSFNPIKVLGNTNTSKGNPRLRRALVIFQFVMVIIFMCSTIIAYHQYNTIKKKKVGIDVNNIVYVAAKGEIGKNFEKIKTELLTDPNITDICYGTETPTFIEHGEFEWGVTPGSHDVLTRLYYASYDFLDVFKVKLVDGRFFSPEYPSDEDNAIIINTEAAKILGLEEPVGEQIYLYHDQYTIVGVIEYFNFFPIDLGGKALIMRPTIPGDHSKRFVFIRHKEETYPYAADHIKSVFEKYNPAFPFEINFYEDYESPIESGLKSLHESLLFFTLFGIFIGILGLLGLVVFITQQKVKEIGIRKAVGASISSIVYLISKEFLRLIIIANCIAIPISYLSVKAAEGFFTVEPNYVLLVYLMVGLSVCAISFLTIFTNSLRAALINPANSLRYE